MRIQEFEDWNKFFIPIKREKNESDEKYISKLNNILDKFYQFNSSIQNWNRSKKYHLESTKWDEHNFMQMFLKKSCDVKYSGIDNLFEVYGPGIHIWSHKDHEKIRIPMINYLKEKWQELEID